MPIRINNDQNINRVCSKMSEDFSVKNNTKFSESVNNTVKYIIDNKSVKSGDQIKINCDHMYASNNENSEVGNCQTAESQVRFIKDWLILHLDLIQQQNDEILDKEKTILILRKENEMLKERINCMEKGTPFQPSTDLNNLLQTEEYPEENFSEDMTQDSAPYDDDNKDKIKLIDILCNENTLKPRDFQENHLSESQIQHNHIFNPATDTQLGEEIAVSEDIKSESEVTEGNNSVSEFNFSIDNCTSGFDPMKNLKMSIRRKRLCSNSSVVSNNDLNNDEKRSYRKFKKKKRRLTKDSQTLTTKEEYVTQTNDVNCGIAADPDPNILTTNLEVPRWRVKLYASCYTMEGTENLDDEVYNKRHSRLEIDERRRKRWDVQRIREQRVIEKLKQRQERIGSGSRGDEHSESVQSLWPKLEDVKFIEVCEELPVSAFGCPIPKIAPSEFSLPWLNNPSFITKKINSKRSTVKRKNVKR